MPALTGGIAGGYAVAGTDDGHQDPNGLDASWALGHPQKVIDFGYRALKETTDTAKAVIAAFYGQGPQWSYFDGCSDGGREALQEAQRYPADWNGIVAGSPANDWTHLFSAFVFNQQQLAKRPIPPGEAATRSKAEALRQCDAADGVVDGVNSDPQRCQLEPEKMRCLGAESDTCLTGPQIKTLHDIMAGPRDPRDRSSLFPGYQLNAVADPAVYPWIFDLQPMTLQAAFGDQFFINMVFEDPAWNYTTLDRTTDVDFADAKLAGILNATDPDLTALQRKGAKVLMYHGWEDNAISPKNSIKYYDSVRADPRGDGKPVKKESFIRLFLAPGMAHCGGGPGPNVFDPLGTLIGWVEHGTAPDRMLAIKPGRAQHLTIRRKACCARDPCVRTRRWPCGTGRAARTTRRTSPVRAGTERRHEAPGPAATTRPRSPGPHRCCGRGVRPERGKVPGLVFFRDPSQQWPCVDRQTNAADGQAGALEWRAASDAVERRRA